MTTQASVGTQAVDRASMLVSAVVRADEPLTFAELQEACGLPKSTTSRMLTALERTELLERNRAGSYVAGPVLALRHPARSVGGAGAPRAADPRPGRRRDG